MSSNPSISKIDSTEAATRSQGSMNAEKITVKLNVERPVLEVQDLRELYLYEKSNISVIQNLKTSLKSTNCKSCIENVVPASKWLRHYKWKDDFLFDVMSGLTVAIMHIPQGMAYAFLGNLSPIVGLYMAFFPVLVYVFLGTSRHVSMGTFAVVCLMTGQAVASYSTPLDTIQNINSTQKLSEEIQILTPIQVATTVTFMVGIIQLLMYILRLGVISSLLSETFVNGFTTGAAIQVLLSQVFDLIGLNSDKPKAPFKLVKTVAVLFSDIPNANIAAVIISLIASSTLMFSNEVLKPWLGKKCRAPVPMELIAVISGTVISRWADLQNVYKIKTVGVIPTG